MKFMIGIAVGMALCLAVEYKDVRTVCNNYALSASVGSGTCSHNGGIKAVIR